MASYDQLLDKGGTIFNQGAKVAYNSADQLAADLGVTKDKIQWGSIAKAGADFNPTGYAGYNAPSQAATVVPPASIPPTTPGLQPTKLDGTPFTPAPSVTPAPTPAFTGFSQVGNSPQVYGTTASGQTVAFENMDQFNQSGGNVSNIQKISTIPTAAVPYTQYQATQQRTQAADQANAEAQKIFDSIGKTDVSTRESSKIVADIKAKLATPPAAPPSLVQTFQQQSEALGIADLNTKLQNFDQQIRAIDTELLTEGDKAGDLVMGQTKINQKRSSMQKEADIRKAYISLERNAVATQLNGKIATLNTIMDLTGQDYSNATNYYNASLDRSLKLYELLSGAEQTEQNEQDKVKTQANANLTTIQNLITEKGLKYDSLTPDQKTQISLLELQAGLPAGATAAISQTNPSGKVLSTTSRQEANGNSYYDSLVQNPDGSMQVVSIFKGKERVPGSSGGGGGSSATPNTPSGTPVLPKTLSAENVRKYLLEMKNYFDGENYYDIWGVAADAIKSIGGNPTTFDNVFWSVFRPGETNPN